jgi:hypothetical protein
MAIIGIFLMVAVVWLRHLLKNKVKYGGINNKQVLLHASLITLTIFTSILLSTPAGTERHFTVWTLYHTCTFLNNITIAVIVIMFNMRRQKNLLQLEERVSEERSSKEASIRIVNTRLDNDCDSENTGES